MGVDGTQVHAVKIKKRSVAKRADTNVAILIQVMADLGFDHETIGKVTGVPLRTINDIANRRGYWAYTAEFNELRESYRLHLRKFILDDAIKEFAALAYRCGRGAKSLAGLFRGKIDDPLDFFERVRSCQYHNEDRSAVAIPYRAVSDFYQAELHYYADSNSKHRVCPRGCSRPVFAGGSGRHQDVKKARAASHGPAFCLRPCS